MRRCRWGWGHLGGVKSRVQIREATEEMGTKMRERGRKDARESWEKVEERRGSNERDKELKLKMTAI